MKLVIGLVLYSTEPSHSSTLNSMSIIDFDSLGLDVTFYIRDNSSNGFGQVVIESYLGDNDVFYDHDGSNMSLSKVYNRMVDYKPSADAILFFDDDSVVNEQYFRQVIKFMLSESVVAIPLIYFSGELISPGKIRGVKGCKLNNKDLSVSIDNFGLVAMMSGTIVKLEVFSRYNMTFNEKLTVYGVDTRFFLDCINNNISLYILDFYMEHDSALRSVVYDFDAMYSRFLNLMRAQFVIHENKPLYKLCLFFYFPIFIFGKVLRLKDVRFLKLFSSYRFFWEL